MTRIASGPVPVVRFDAGMGPSSWVSALPQSEPLFVVAVDTPDSQNRTVARQTVRAALQKVLSALWCCEPASVTLTSTPGEPLRAHGPHSPTWGLSLSHEAGLSVAAVNRFGLVGVDIVETSTEWDWRGVALDYLGPDVATDIAAQPLIKQNQAFLQAWARHEAQLKCLSLGLVEWSPPLQSRLVALNVADLDLPTGWLGAIASG